MGIIRAVVIQIVEALGVAFVLAWAMCRCPLFALAPYVYLSLALHVPQCFFKSFWSLQGLPRPKHLNRLICSVFLGSDILPLP